MSLLSRWLARKYGIPEVRLISDADAIKAFDAAMQKAGLDVKTRALVLSYVEELM